MLVSIFLSTLSFIKLHHVGNRKVLISFDFIKWSSKTFTVNLAEKYYLTTYEMNTIVFIQ